MRWGVGSNSCQAAVLRLGSRCRTIARRSSTPQSQRVSSFSSNRLLAALSRPERARLASKSEELELDIKQIIYEPGQQIDHVYFPLDGMFCLLTVLSGGSRIEVATVGNEGMLGLGALLGFDTYLWQAMSQIPGHSLRVQGRAFKAELDRRGNLHRMVQRYTRVLLMKVSQSAACNRVHSTEQRLCKWLLMTHDRAAADEFPLTHEFISQMLGVRRAGVTEIAGSLQRAGLISYRRGTLTILDRPGLEAASCECYARVRKEFARI